MPNTNEYHLYIHLDDEGGVNKSPVANKEQSSDGGNADSDEGIKKLVGGVAVYKTMKSFATQMISYTVGTIELRSGTKEYQQKMQFLYDVGMGIFNVVEGAILGGKVGGAPGAVIGAVVGMASTAISYAQNQNTIYLNQAIENVSILQNNVRAGTANRRMNY